MAVCRRFSHGTPKRARTNLMRAIDDRAKLCNGNCSKTSMPPRNLTKARVSSLRSSSLTTISLLCIDNSLNDTIPLKPTNGNRRSRGSFTVEQTAILEQVFAHTPYPDVTTRETLSERLSVDVSRIQIWFSNRRARTRKVVKPAVSPQPSPAPYQVESPPTMENHPFDPTFASSPSTGKRMRL